MRTLTTSLCGISGGLYQQFSAWVTLSDSIRPAEKDFLADRIAYTPLKINHEKEKDYLIKALGQVEEYIHLYKSYGYESYNFYYGHRSSSVFEDSQKQTQIIW